jgi:branched-chain amino acid transport system substrate-binding protein
MKLISEVRAGMIQPILAVLIAGLLGAPAAWAATVKVGLSLPLTGVQAGLGKEAESVWRAFAKHANAKQMLGGHSLEVLVLDDAFDPDKSRANAEQFAKQGVAVMAGTAGIPTVQAMLKTLEANKMPLLGPGSGSLVLRGKSPALFHVKASFGAEVDKMGQLFGTMALKKIAVITDDAGDRKALVERFGAALQRASGSTSHVVHTAVVTQTAGRPKEAVAQALAAQPAAVYVMTIPGLAGDVLKELRAQGYRGTLAAWSVAATDAVTTALGSAGAGVIFGTIVPSPASELPGIRAKFRAFAKEQDTKPTYRAMEIYITGRILAEALARGDATPVTSAKVWAALEGLRDASLDGWRVHYSATERDGSSFVDTMMLLDNGKFR